MDRLRIKLDILRQLKKIGCHVALDGAPHLQHHHLSAVWHEVHATLMSAASIQASMMPIPSFKPT